MRQPTFLRGGGSLTQIIAIGASFCKADRHGSAQATDILDVFVSFMSSRRDGLGISDHVSRLPLILSIILDSSSPH
jgi:hypothetical protein